MKSLRQQQIKQSYSAFDSLPKNIEVGIWEQKKISLLPEERTKKIIFINALNGCCVLAMIMKCKSGTRHVIMSQVLPEETQIQELTQAIMQINDDEIMCKTLIVLTGGKITKVNDTRYQFTPTSECLRHIHSLGEAVQVTHRFLLTLNRIIIKLKIIRIFVLNFHKIR